MVLGVVVRDWELFLLGPFPLCLGESLVLASSSFRIVSVKELLKLIANMCSTKIPLGSNLFSFNTFQIEAMEVARETINLVHIPDYEILDFPR